MEDHVELEASNKTFEVRHFPKLKKTSSLLLLAMLTACSGGGGSDDGGGADDSLSVLPVPDIAGSYRYLGYIDLIDNDSVKIDANFFEFVDIQDASDFGRSVPSVEDSCSARVLDSFPSNAGTIGFPELPFTLLTSAGGGDAGEMVVFTSPGGTYATYHFSDSRFDIATRPILDNLTLDLTVNTFPDFSSVTVPEIPKITGFQPRSITQGTVFTWTPLDANTGSIYMDYVNFGPIAGGTGGSKYVEIYCRMKNDGEFALPQAVENILTEGLGAGFTLSNVQRTLKASNLVIKDDAVFVVTRRNGF